MLSEYDFKGKKGVRGKYHEAFKKGYTVRVYDENGTVTAEYFAAISSDVHEYFPDSDSINKALRSLIALIPNK
ncbi:MAG TPA: hypothetical protein VF648_10800 [Pyrinomonadaceae bacterium]